MMNENFYFTKSGLKKIKKEINALEQRLKKLQSQTAHLAEVGGDQWHDNPAYESLVIEIRGLDRRISDAHRVLNNAIIVESPINFEKVVIGTRVKIEKDGEEMIWDIVGFGESNPENGALAYNTPLASLIMGKGKGEMVTGIIAKKKIEIEILEIIEGRI